jgi:3-hydroxyacyl-[acyl-carrier-protein] dehydratase
VNPIPEPPPEDDPVLREALKRCSPATYYAACKFRATGHIEHLHALVVGVVERFVDRDLRPKLQGSAESLSRLSLTQDLALDSLTMMEIVMLAEEVLGVSISNEELTRLRTLGDVQSFVVAKIIEARSAPAPASRRSADAWDIAAACEDVRRIETAAAAVPINRIPQ